MKYPDIESFNPDPAYFEEIHPNVWLMDDHRWAYFLWEQNLNRGMTKVPRSLLHLDYHWDGINDFHKDSDQDQLCNIIEIKEIYRIVKEGKMVRKDSFIAPAIIRGIINEVHFLCFQNDENPGLDEEFLRRISLKQFFHDDLQSLINHAPKSSLLDIDLDIFNKSDLMETDELWTDNEILEFLDTCRKLIRSSPFITIAMSFDYSGSKDGTKHLTRLVVPKLVGFRR